jgi:hypothetical protein
MKKIMALICTLALAGCASVRQSDLDAWVGVPVEALDTHSIFLTMPMIRTVSESGIEIRNYANTKEIASCSGNGSGAIGKNSKTVSVSSFSNCTSSTVGCNNIFYVKGGKVLEYAPTGQCFTNETARPQKRFHQLTM